MMSMLQKFVMSVALVLAVSTTARAADEFVLLGVHPNAKNQSTRAGKVLSTLYGYNGLIYTGYGDYGDNTGPIAIRAWNPATNDWTPNMLTSRTEAIYTYREINGRLYAPAIDAKNLEDQTYAYTVGNSNVWQDRGSIDTNRVAEHVFDMVSYHGDLYLAGSMRGNTADIYKSTDNGATWTLAHSVTPSAQGDFNRFYGLVVYQDKLWAQATAYYNYAPRLPAQSEVYDGTSWTAGPSLNPTGSTTNVAINHPLVFAGKMIYQTYHPGVWMSQAYTFDGTNVGAKLLIPQNTSYDSPDGPGGHTTYLDQWLYDMNVDGSTLYALTYDHHIYTTTDLTNWTLFANAPNNASSLLVYQGHFYLGTGDSQLMVWSAPVPEPASLSMLAFGGLMLLHRRRGA